MKYVKAFENFGEPSENVSNMYDKFGKEYPLAADLIAYYIFNYKNSDNNIKKYIDTHAPELSAVAMDYEYNWADNMEKIESEVKDIVNESVNISNKPNDDSVIGVLNAIGKIEKIFDDEYIPNLKALIENNLIDSRLLDHASDTTNDFAALKSWANKDYIKRTK